MFVAYAACGVALLFIRPLDRDGAPVHLGGLLVCAFTFIIIGFPGVALLGREMVTRWRWGREVDAMTRLHVVPVSRS
jgi:hypothetical protein